MFTIVGERFRVRGPKRSKYYVVAQCGCGNRLILLHTRVCTRATTHCGCERNYAKGERHPQYSHGNSGSYTYSSWCAMKSRCLCPTDKDYKRYGERGIQICPEWLYFDRFLKDMGERPPNTTIERVDNNGDYTPDNCVWATAKVQANNRRSKSKITINGETKQLSEWVAIYGAVSLSTAQTRMYRDKWNPIDAVSLPPDKRRRVKR